MLVIAILIVHFCQGKRKLSITLKRGVTAKKKIDSYNLVPKGKIVNQDRGQV